jgi:hypothetical protein
MLARVKSKWGGDLPKVQDHSKALFVPRPFFGLIEECQSDRNFPFNFDALGIEQASLLVSGEGLF